MGSPEPQPLTEGSLRSYYPAKSVVPTLARLWKSMTDAETWLWLYERLPPRASAAEPVLRWKRGEQPMDGRFGLDLYPDWQPGIFFGAMLDPSDHRVELSNSALGPDLCLIVTYHRGPDIHPPAKAFLESAEFTALRERLARGSGRWEFVDVLRQKNPNLWHPLHLRRPLAEVLRGTRSFEEQRDVLLEEARAMIDVLLGGSPGDGELERWLASARV